MVHDVPMEWKNEMMKWPVVFKCLLFDEVGIRSSWITACRHILRHEYLQQVRDSLVLNPHWARYSWIMCMLIGALKMSKKQSGRMESVCFSYLKIVDDRYVSSKNQPGVVKILLWPYQIDGYKEKLVNYNEAPKSKVATFEELAVITWLHCKTHFQCKLLTRERDKRDWSTFQWLDYIWGGYFRGVWVYIYMYIQASIWICGTDYSISPIKQHVESILFCWWLEIWLKKASIGAYGC